VHGYFVASCYFAPGQMPSVVMSISVFLSVCLSVDLFAYLLLCLFMLPCIWLITDIYITPNNKADLYQIL